MQSGEKFCRSLARALNQLPEVTAKEASALLTPENIVIMTAMMAAWMGTQGIPVAGQAVDAALLSLGVILIAAQSVELTQEIWKYANKTRDARSHEELDSAAGHLARAVAIAGVNVIAFILSKRAIRGGGPDSSGYSPGLVTANGPRGASAVAEGARPAAAAHMVNAPRSPRALPARPLKSVNLEAFAR